MKYRIPQLVPFVDDRELSNLQQVIRRKWLTEGPFAHEFLGLILEYTKAKYGILTNNGTLALFLALKAIGIEPGDEVIVPDFTFIASATSVVFAGGRPVFVDVDPATLNLDAEQLEQAITKKTKAVMPVHVYGQAADMDAVLRVARRHRLKVVEDAAQGFGVFYKGRHTGTMGTAGTISFFADKTITTGEGAVVLTNDRKTYLSLRYLRNQGRLGSGSFIHPYLGMNFRMTDLQCAVGVAQLRKFEEIKRAKLRNYALYQSLLEGVAEATFVEVSDDSNFVPFRVNVRVKKLRGLMKFLEQHSIQTRGFFYPLHRQPCFKYLGYRREAFPNSNALYDSGLSLPIFPAITERQIRYICRKIRQFYGYR